jgi:hypothetical protein
MCARPANRTLHRRILTRLSMQRAACRSSDQSHQRMLTGRTPTTPFQSFLHHLISCDEPQARTSFMLHTFLLVCCHSFCAICLQNQGLHKLVPSNALHLLVCKARHTKALTFALNDQTTDIFQPTRYTSGLQ